MKKNIRLIVAVVLALVVAASTVALIACQKEEHVCNHKCEICGLCTDKECKDKVCEEKCQGHAGPVHKCNNVCPKCGKCTDPNCKDPACAEKCQGHEEDIVKIPVKGEVRYDLGVIQGFAKLKNADVSSFGGKESFVTNFTWQRESSVTMEIWCNAKEDVQTDFVIKVRRTQDVLTLTNQIMVDVNGDVLESEAQVPSSAEGADAEFAEVNLGQFWLSPGLNTIIVKPQANINNFDFSAIIFYSTKEADLQWNDMRDVSGKAFLGVDDHVTYDGGFKLNRAENCLGVGAYTAASATFPVYSSRQAKAKIYIITNSMPLPMKVTDYFDWTINDRKLVSDAALPYNAAPWGNYKIVEVGEYLLDAGLNTIKMSLSNNILAFGNDYNRYYNLRGIIIDTDAKIGFDEQTPEAHVCLSVCPVCGGCQNATCADVACTKKCTCAHVCKNVCEICGGCKDAECTEPECATKCDCITQEYKLNGGNVTIDNQTYNEKEDCVGCKWTAENGYEPVTTTYKLDASEAVKVKLYMTVTRFYSAGKLIGDAYDVSINGEAISSNAQYNAGTPWAEYDRIYIGTYDLVKGTNTIVIVYAHAANQDGGALNFRCITLEHSAKVTIDFTSRGELTNAEIEQNPAKTEYNATEVFDASGLKLKLTYSDGTTRIVDNGFTYSEDPLEEGATSITVSYTEGEITKTVNVAITVADPKTEKEFGLADTSVSIVGGKYNTAEDVFGTYHDGTQYHTVTATYKLVSSKAVSAKLYFTVSRFYSAGQLIGGAYDVTINGKAIESSAQYNAGQPWVVFDKVYIGTYDFIVGENTIVIAYAHPENQAGANLNFHSMTLEYSASATIDYAAAPQLESIEVTRNPDKTAYNAGETFNSKNLEIKLNFTDGITRIVDGGFTFSTEPLVEGATSITVSYTAGEVTKTTEVAITVADSKTTKEFKLNNTAVTIEGKTYDEKEDCVGAAYDGTQYQPVTITYKITASKATKVKLYFTVSRSPAAHKLVGEAYDVSINGSAITSDAMYIAGEPWKDYDTIYIGTYDLVEGENTITIVYAHMATYQSGATLNFRSISLEYSASLNIDYAMPTAE